jgi:hypothetical protein
MFCVRETMVDAATIVREDAAIITSIDVIHHTRDGLVLLQRAVAESAASHVTTVHILPKTMVSTPPPPTTTIPAAYYCEHGGCALAGVATGPALAQKNAAW